MRASGIEKQFTLQPPAIKDCASSERAANGCAIRSRGWNVDARFGIVSAMDIACAWPACADGVRKGAVKLNQKRFGDDSANGI